jgi:hypothetical protein
LRSLEAQRRGAHCTSGLLALVDRKHCLKRPSPCPTVMYKTFVFPQVLPPIALLCATECTTIASLSGQDCNGKIQVSSSTQNRTVSEQELFLQDSDRPWCYLPLRTQALPARPPRKTAGTAARTACSRPHCYQARRTLSPHRQRRCCIGAGRAPVRAGWRSRPSHARCRRRSAPGPVENETFRHSPIAVLSLSWQTGVQTNRKQYYQRLEMKCIPRHHWQ